MYDWRHFHRRDQFIEQLCHQLLELLILTLEFFYLTTVRLALCVTVRTLVSRSQELLAPAIKQIAVDPFTRTEFCNCRFAA